MFSKVNTADHLLEMKGCQGLTEFRVVLNRGGLAVCDVNNLENACVLDNGWYPFEPLDSLKRMDL